MALGYYWSIKMIKIRLRRHEVQQIIDSMKSDNRNCDYVDVIIRPDALNSYATIIDNGVGKTISTCDGCDCFLDL